MRSFVLFILSVSSFTLITGCGGRNEPPAAFSYGTAAPLDKSHRKIVVQSGQSLSFIARKYGVTEKSITTLNNLPLDAVLRVGQEIYLPKNIKPRSKKIAQLRAKPKPSTIETTQLEPLEPLESSNQPSLKTPPKAQNNEWVDMETAAPQEAPLASTKESADIGTSTLQKKKKDTPQKKHQNDDFFDTMRGEEIDAELKSFKDTNKQSEKSSLKTDNKTPPKKAPEPFDPSKDDEDNNTDSKSDADTNADDIEKESAALLPDTSKTLKLPAKAAEKPASPQPESTKKVEKAAVKEADKTPPSEPKEKTTVTPAPSEVSPAEAEATEPAATDPSNFAWPLPFKGETTLSFNQVINGAKNDGININVPRGTPVNAIGDGTIVHASPVKGFGNLVLIKHNETWMSAYGHMDKILVKQGSKIKKGQKIGTVGQTGYVKTPQLHFELRQASKPVDPTKYLAP